jgi:hypothetical protein
MRCPGRACGMVLGVVLLCSVIPAGGQVPGRRPAITLTVVDEDGLPVPGAQITVSEPGRAAVRFETDYAGRCAFTLESSASTYQLQIQKPGFYQVAENQADAHRPTIEVSLAHEQLVRKEVNVLSSTSGIDTEQTSDKFTAVRHIQRISRSSADGAHTAD